MNINEIRYFERKMTDSAFDDAVKCNPNIAVRASLPQKDLLMVKRSPSARAYRNCHANNVLGARARSARERPPGRPQIAKRAKQDLSRNCKSNGRTVGVKNET